MGLIDNNYVLEDLLVRVSVDCHEAVDEGHDLQATHHPQVDLLIILGEPFDGVCDPQSIGHFKHEHSKESINKHDWQEWTKHKRHQIDDVYLRIHVVQVKVIARIQLFVSLNRLFPSLGWQPSREAALALVNRSQKVPQEEKSSEFNRWDDDYDQVRLDDKGADI